METEIWDWEAPDWAALDTIRRSPLPFVLWPVCEKPLLAHWMDESVRRAVPRIRLLAMDRPHLVREWLAHQNLWSREIEVVSSLRGANGRAPVLLDHLPGTDARPRLETPPDLLRHWFALQQAALAARSSQVVHVDHEIQPGVWVGPAARIAGSARLQAPCWIGAHAHIGPHCRIGPDAFIGPGAFLDEDVEVRASLVCSDTYVGAHTSLEHMVAQGGFLVDLRRGAGVEILDRFVLSEMRSDRRRPGWPTRILALLCAPLLEVAAKWLAGKQPPASFSARLERGRSISLRTYPKGPLAIRRARWLREVAAGNLRLSGVLPRSEEQWQALPPDIRTALESSPPGVFALSDLYDSHSAEKPDEWLHAIFQAASPDGAGQALAGKNLWRIAWKNPVGP